LHEHLGSLEALQDDLQAHAASQLEQTCGRFENELASLRTTLAERERTIVESRAGLLEIEAGLKSEIASLRDELKEKQRALAVRDDRCVLPTHRSPRSKSALATGRSLSPSRRRNGRNRYVRRS
jgi:peptidoglycan hydrolase CwlO-like protein